MPESLREDVAELEKLLGGEQPEASTPGTPDAAAQPTPQPTQEEIDYFLNGKANRLPVNAEFSFPHDGKVVKAPLSTILNNYRQRADVDKKYGDLKKQREEFAKYEGDVKWLQEHQDLVQMDKWVREHPQEWNTLQEVWKQKNELLLSGGATTQQAAAGANAQTAASLNLPPNHPIIQQLVALQQQLEKQGETISKYETELQNGQKERDIKEIDGEVEEFKKTWPEVNLDDKDADGVSLKYKIMVHGTDNNIPDFRKAARDFLFDRLLDIASQRGRTEAVKGVQKDRQQGILSKSSTPSKSDGQSAQVNPKAGWTDLQRAATAELEGMLAGKV